MPTILLLLSAEKSTFMTSNLIILNPFNYDPMLTGLMVLQLVCVFVRPYTHSAHVSLCATFRTRPATRLGKQWGVTRPIAVANGSLRDPPLPLSPSLPKKTNFFNWGCPADLLTNQTVQDPKVHGHTSRMPPIGIESTSPDARCRSFHSAI